MFPIVLASVFEKFGKKEFWTELLKSDFNRGFLAAFVLIIALFLAFLVLKICFAVLFRVRSCHQILVHRDDGDILVDSDAIDNAAERVFLTFPDLNIRRIRLYRDGRHYRMDLVCSIAHGCSCTDLIAQVKPALLSTLKETFGIESVRSIRFLIEALKGESAAPIKISAPEPVPSEEGSNDLSL